MADNTPIEWCDATVNAINGCSLASPGCTNCYAMKLAGTRLKNHPSRQGLTIDTKTGPVWSGEVRLHEPALLQPLRWQRPRTIFWNAHGDLFHPNVTDETIDRVFAVAALTPQHTHLILTKRSARMRLYAPAIGAGDDDRWRTALASVGTGVRGSLAMGEALEFLTRRGPLANVCFGVSIEDHPRLEERAWDLKATPAAIRFWSAEPLIGGLGQIPTGLLPDGVIVGGESGPGARPMHPDWARSLRDQCAAAGVDFHFKQWGSWLPEGQFDRHQLLWAPGNDGRVHWWHPEPPYGSHLRDGHCSIRIGKKQAGRTLDGMTHDALPWRRGE